MNILPFEKQTAAIAARTDGCSIRATERLTGIHRDTVMRLGVRVGEGCDSLHDGMMRNLQVSLLQLDEAWSYVAKKQRQTTALETNKGDQYVYIALDVTNKAIISYLVGKRTAENTGAFAQDIYNRIINRPQITTDGLEQYIWAIDDAFGISVDYAQLVKVYKGEPAKDAARRYSPGWVVKVRHAEITGYPDRRYISTSHVERQNLSLRMAQRRFTRLTNGFSKKLENHRAAVALYVSHYNLCRVHETLRVTPAMALGVTDHIWTIGEIVEVATDGLGDSYQG